MLYMTCPTCGFFFGQKVLEYEQKKIEICSNPNFNKVQKEKEISKLLNSLGLRRYCCKMRIMTYKDLAYEILPINQ